MRVASQKLPKQTLCFTNISLIKRADSFLKSFVRRTHADHLRALNVQARNKKDRPRRKGRSHIDAELDDYDDGLSANVVNPLSVCDGNGWVIFNHSKSMAYNNWQLSFDLPQDIGWLAGGLRLAR